MEFLITAYDGKDEAGIERRMAARAEHLKLGSQMINEGKLLYAAAILDDQEKMIGSSMVLNFSDRKELDAWLKIEPYVTGNVWQTIDVRQCRVGPDFVRQK